MFHGFPDTDKKDMGSFSFMTPHPQHSKFLLLKGKTAESKGHPVDGRKKFSETTPQESLLTLTMWNDPHMTEITDLDAFKDMTRTSLHLGFNIPGNNCSFLLHDIMLNYTSLSFVFRMGYSELQMI